MTDEETLDRLERRLIELSERANTPRILLRLNHVRYISSRGLGKLVAIHKRLARRGGALELYGASDSVREVLAITQLTKLFVIAPEADWPMHVETAGLEPILAGEDGRELVIYAPPGSIL
jgi:anti-anti-sigma factor